MSSKSYILNSSSLGETLRIGQIIGANLKGGEVIELIGDLGSGKTALVKGIAEGAGSKELVASPSFTICNEYQASKFKIYHFDFYRLNEPGIIRRELAEVVGSKTNVIVVEWPSIIEDILPKERIVIKLSVNAEDSRIFNIIMPTGLGYLTKGLS